MYLGTLILLVLGIVPFAAVALVLYFTFRRRKEQQGFEVVLMARRAETVDKSVDAASKY